MSPDELEPDRLRFRDLLSVMFAGEPGWAELRLRRLLVPDPVAAHRQRERVMGHEVAL